LIWRVSFITYSNIVKAFKLKKEVVLLPAARPLGFRTENL